MDIGSLSDPFVQVKLGNEIIAKTRVVMNDLDPKFYSVFSIVIRKSELDSGKDDFVMQVKHSGKLASSHLGTSSVLKLGRFVQLLDADTMDPEERYDIIQKWGTPLYDPYDVWTPLYDENQSLIKSTLKMDLGIFLIIKAYFPVNMDEQVIASAGIVNFVIHQAKELSTKRIASPSCRVFYRGSLLCKTPHKKKTNNPAWNFKHLFFCSDINESKLTFDLYDDSGSLGKCIVNISEGLRNDQWYLLSTNHGKIKISFKFTPIDLSQSRANKLLLSGNEPLGLLKINVIEAKGLSNVELLGKSDPYCKVLLAKNYVGVTSAIPNTLDPEWRMNFFGIPYSMDDELAFELYDYNETMKDRWLGKVSFPIGLILSDLKNSESMDPHEAANDGNLLDTLKADGLEIRLKDESTIDM